MILLFEIILAYSIAFFIPGFCLVKALFPETVHVDRLESILLSATLSMGILSLCITALAFLGELHFLNILVLILLFCILCSLVWFRSARGDLILDIGCGDAMDLARYADSKVCELVGVDFSKESIAQSKMRH